MGSDEHQPSEGATREKKAALRVLLAEDSDLDAKLVGRALRRGLGVVALTRVEDVPALRQALVAQPWDAVVSDWSMPHFSALHALDVVRDLGTDIPFIIISGSIGEEAAVGAMRAGAHDVVLKGNLARLVPAIERALAERESRVARAEAERALRVSNHRFQRMWDSGIVGIVEADLLGNVHDANDAALQMFGYSRDEMREVQWPSLTPSELRTGQEDLLNQLQTAGVSHLRETEMFRKDGERVQVLIGVAMLDFPRCMVFVADRTDRARVEESLRRTETQLRHSQKMEAVGRLAGGVAHDFNNLLSVVLSYSSMAIESLKEGDPLRDDLQEIARAGQRAAELTGQLLAFSRQRVVQSTTINLNESLEKMDKILRRVLGEDVELVGIAGSDLWSIDADPGQVEQILMNLAVNARDAMPTGGKLTIATKNEWLDEAFALAHSGTRAGPHVVLSVTDTGTGMTAATQARIFEPFFTTKELGKGTGLGLSTVFGIVQQSGGSIWVDSEPDRGSSFRVYLPPSNRTSEAPIVRPASVPPPREGAVTILLAEDEEQVRHLVRGILARKGYHVLVARNAQDAVAISREYAGTIDLLLTDVVMPGMNGRELADGLRLSRPRLSVVYMSGYTGNVVLRHGVLDEGAAFVQKPITPQELLKCVHEMLAATPPSA